MSKLELQLVGIYESLCRKAFQITRGNQSNNLMNSIRILIDRWADTELRLLGEQNDLIEQKSKVLESFEQLSASFDTDKAQKLPSGVCKVCGAELTLAYYADDLVCFVCAHPAIKALDELVRASTMRFSPEELLATWKAWKANFDHGGG